MRIRRRLLEGDKKVAIARKIRISDVSINGLITESRGESLINLLRMYLKTKVYPSNLKTVLHVLENYFLFGVYRILVELTIELLHLMYYK